MTPHHLVPGVKATKLISSTVSYHLHATNLSEQLRYTYPPTAISSTILHHHRTLHYNLLHPRLTYRHYRFRNSIATMKPSHAIILILILIAIFCVAIAYLLFTMCQRAASAEIHEMIARQDAEAGKSGKEDVKA